MTDSAGGIGMRSVGRDERVRLPARLPRWSPVSAARWYRRARDQQGRLASVDPVGNSRDAFTALADNPAAEQLDRGCGRKREIHVCFAPCPCGDLPRIAGSDIQGSRCAQSLDSEGLEVDGRL